MHTTLSAAAGVDRNVLVWDLRHTNAQVGRWNNAHKHEVTHLKLLPHAPTHAVVGGVDYEVLVDGGKRGCLHCLMHRWHAGPGMWRLVKRLPRSQGEQ